MTAGGLWMILWRLSEDPGRPCDYVEVVCLGVHMERRWRFVYV